MIKKMSIGGIVFLFLSTACLSVGANDEKPDLIIEDLGTEPANTMYHNWIFCVIKNIGTGVASEISEKVTIRRVLFGIFLLDKTLDSFYASEDSSSGLLPNKTTNLGFSLDTQLPSWGFYRLYCQVNPDKIIEETDYTNNFYTKDVLVLFGNWVKALK